MHSLHFWEYWAKYRQQCGIIKQFIRVDLNFSTYVKTNLPVPSMSIRLLGVCLSSADDRCMLILCLEFFPIHGGRNVNDVEEFKRCWNLFNFYPIYFQALTSFDSSSTSNAGKSLSTVSFVEPELMSGSWAAVLSDWTWSCTWKSTLLAGGGIPSTGDTLSLLVHHSMIHQASLTLWPPDWRIKGAFSTFWEALLLRAVSNLHKNVNNASLLEWVHQEPKPERSCKRSASTNAESSFFKFEINT